MSDTIADNGNDDFRSRGQQPMLASQRQNAGNNTPTEANRTGKVGGYFTLGYKEAIGQWVRKIDADRKGL